MRIVNSGLKDFVLYLAHPIPKYINVFDHHTAKPSVDKSVSPRSIDYIILVVPSRHSKFR